MPLFPRLAPCAAYLTLGEALADGLSITETSDTGTAPRLVVHNPLAERVLLHDGEELVGAKQNRNLDVSVLVEAKSALPVPVSCVEQGRWRHVSREFAAAPQTAHPELRRRKAMRLAAAPLVAGAAQGEAWDAVADKASRLGVASPTSANADTFRAHAPRIEELEPRFPAEKGQSGALLALGHTLCLDWVSRPEAFAQLWPKLRRGSLLDALETLDRPPTRPETIERFLGALDGAGSSEGPSAGIGVDLRLSAPGVIGSGLALDGELLQLTAFSAPAATPSGRIARPSRRLI